MSPLVEKGNNFRISPTDVYGIRANKITVTWSQNLGSHTQEYIVCKYTANSGST